ncbi:MAG: ACT domain-containing protein, partial [Pseudomonadota bacterium]
PLDFAGVFTEGISHLELKDMSFAEEFGYKIKHLGIAKRDEQGIEMRVHPTLIPEKRLIANVNGVMNAVLVKGDAVGNTLHYGAGAGAGPTGSAVVADLVDLLRAADYEQVGDAAVWHWAWQAPLGFDAASLSTTRVKPQSEFRCPFYLRLEVKDQVGVMSKLTSVFAKHDISLEGIKQKEPAQGEVGVSVILITQECIEGTLHEVIDALQALPEVTAPIVRIRVAPLD